MKDDRPQLAAMLAVLREGDQVVVVKLDRISRSTKHLIELSERFDEMGVDFVSLGDSIDTSTPMGRFFFKVMASIAELERDIIAERTKDGLKAARARGRKGGRFSDKLTEALTGSARARGRKGGRPRADRSKVDTARKMYESGSFSIGEICASTGISKSTLYRYLH